MRDTVLQQATAIWEVTLKLEESEGHTQIAASLLQVENAFAEPKSCTVVSRLTSTPKVSGNQQLRTKARTCLRLVTQQKQNSQVQNNAYSMHRCRL